MLSEFENQRLTRVGPGTPMGNLLRRYWMPALLASEVAEPDGPPVRVRLLGEDLIAFRDSDGRVGLVDAFCPHRRAPMFFGRNEECGLRCVYHGWKFDRNGTCVDMPSEPPDSLFKTKVRIPSYPTWEGGDIVWAYMGPAELAPPPPEHEFVRTPTTHRFVSRTLEDCNWLQALEGGMDSTHLSILHSRNRGDLTFLQNFENTVPIIDVQRTDYGYQYTGTRKLKGDLWVRGYQYIMPAVQLRGMAYERSVGGSQTDFANRIDGHFWVPFDDEHTCVYNFHYAMDPDRPIPEHEVHAFDTQAGRGPEDLLPDFHPKRSLSNDYLIDRQLQKTYNFTGITGVNTEDYAMQEGMGPIVDRSKEHLGSTDRAVIVLRQVLAEAVDAVERGADPPGLDPATYRSMRAFDVLVPAGKTWEETHPMAPAARY